MGICSSSSSTSDNINKLWKNIQLNESIGNGGFANIKKGYYVTKKKNIAVKILNINHCLSRSNGIEMLKNEIETLKLLTYNPHISNLYLAYHDYIHCYLALDLFEGGDLRYYISARQCFKEKQIAFVIGCISSALSHIHSKGVLHRDVKPENILFDSHGYPKLIDFGVSCICEDSSLSCNYSSGTLSYLAPEVLTSSHIHGKGSDYWSLGIVLYEMLYLSKPWKSHCPKEFVRFIEEYYGGNGGSKSNTRRLNSVTYCIQESNDSIDDVPHPNTLLTHSTQSYHSESTEYFIETPPCITENCELPPHLTVPLNEYSAYGQYISAECLNLLSGLLDIRLDKRLGSSFSGTVQFLKHSWWKFTQTPLDGLMKCEKESDLKKFSSPIIVDTATIQETIKWTNKMNSMPISVAKPDIAYESKSSSSFHFPTSINGLRNSFSLQSPSNKNQYVVPVNYSENVSLVLDRYSYVGPLF